MPDTFEWRLLQLEQQRQDHEKRIRDVEANMSIVNAKLDAVGLEVAEIKGLAKNIVESINKKDDDSLSRWVSGAISVLLIIAAAFVGHYIK